MQNKAYSFLSTGFSLISGADLSFVSAGLVLSVGLVVSAGFVSGSLLGGSCLAMALANVSSLSARTITMIHPPGLTLSGGFVLISRLAITTGIHKPFSVASA